MLRDIYLGAGLFSFLAWIGTAATLGIITVLVVAAVGMRTPRVRPVRVRRRWHLVARLKARNARIVDEREWRANR